MRPASLASASLGVVVVALVVGCGSSDSGTPPPKQVDSGSHDSGTPFVPLTLTMPSCGGGGEITREGTTMTYVATSTINVPLGATVTMNAKPDAYSTFAGWTGDCTGEAAACTLTMDAAKTIAPTFHPATGGGAYRAFSSKGEDTLRSIAIDAEGGSIVLGRAGGAIDLGAGSVGTDGKSLTFLARYDVAAKPSWTKPLPVDAPAARLAKGGDVVIAGTFQGTPPDLGGGALVPVDAAKGSFFVARFAHGDGAHVSSKAFGVALGVTINLFAIDPADDAIVLAGAYGKGTDLGGGALVPDAGIFVTRLTKDGALEWARTIAVKPFYYAESLAIDGAGDVLLGGHFEQGTIDLGGGVLSAVGPTTSASFLAKFAKTGGAHVWSKAYGTGSHNHLRALAVGPSNALSLFANVSGSVTFGGPTLTSKGYDFAVVRLASDASFGWQTQFSGPYVEEARAIALDSAGDLVLASTYERKFVLGANEIPAAALTDVLVAKVKGTDGTPTWVRHVGCAGEDDVAAIALDGAAVRVVGTFKDTIDLGDGPQKAQGTDAFLLTFAP